MIQSEPWAVDSSQASAVTSDLWQSVTVTLKQCEISQFLLHKNGKFIWLNLNRILFYELPIDATDSGNLR